MAKKFFAALLSLTLVFSIFAVASTIDGNSFAARANAEPGSDWAIPTNPAIPTDPAVPTDPAIPDDGKEPSLEDGVIVSADEHFCGCCHKHNHSKGLFDRIKCFFCKFFSFFKKETDIVHKYVKISESAPTCSNNTTVIYKCAVCHVRVILTGEHMQHSMVRCEVGRAATCEQCGYSAYEVCSQCGIVRLIGVIPPKGHTVAVIKSIPPECNKNGRTEGSVCSVCGKMLVYPQIVPTTVFHEYIAIPCGHGAFGPMHCYICKNCGYNKSGTTSCTFDKFEYPDGEKPSCTQEKTYYKICSECGYKIKCTMPKIEHTINDSVFTVQEPTCTEAGKKIYTCSVCDTIVKEINSTEPLGHDIEDMEITGDQSVFCKRCNTTFRIQTYKFDFDNNDFLLFNSETFFFNCTIDGEVDFDYAVKQNGSVFINIPVELNSTDIEYIGYLTMKNGDKFLCSSKTGQVKHISLTSHYITQFFDMLPEKYHTLLNYSDCKLNFAHDLDLRNANRSILIKDGIVYNKFSFTKEDGTKVAIYIKNRKLCSIDFFDSNGSKTGTIQINAISSEVPTYMYTAKDTRLSDDHRGFELFTNDYPLIKEYVKSEFPDNIDGYMVSSILPEITAVFMSYYAEEAIQWLKNEYL